MAARLSAMFLMRARYSSAEELPFECFETDHEEDQVVPEIVAEKVSRGFPKPVEMSEDPELEHLRWATKCL